MTGKIVRTLTVTIDDKGHVEVTGSVADKAGCYAMLELAKDLVREHHRPVIQPVRSLGSIK